MTQIQQRHADCYQSNSDCRLKKLQAKLTRVKRRNHSKRQTTPNQRKIYFRTKSKVRMYINIVTFEDFPVDTFKIV